MPAKGWKKPVVGDLEDPDSLVVWARRYIEHLRVRGYADGTIVSTEGRIQLFVEWAWDRGITRPTEVSKPILEAYQRYNFYFRKKGGKPLSFSAQRQRIQSLRTFFRWLAKGNVITANPASDLDLPRAEKRLPRAILSEREAEQVLAVPDLTEPIGLRDRAMMEVLYSTGLRRAELANLEVFDIDSDRGTLTVRQGKNRKDRTVPIGERALHWVDRYSDEVRPTLVVPPDDGVLFLSEEGERLHLPRVTQLMRRYLIASNVKKPGSVHIWRHTMATLLLEGGMDIRLIQSLLGHSKMSTTEVYTRVSIQHLKRAYDQAHPGAKLTSREAPEAGDGEDEPTREKLLQALDEEAEVEDSDEDE